jgi:hypothetical protein
MVEIVFTPEEKARIFDEGHRRQSYNESRGLRGRNNAPSKGATALGMNLIGAAAELAVARYLDMEEHLFAEVVPVRGSCDLPGIEIKCRSKHGYDLLVQTDDNIQDKKYVLVTIADKKTLIVGWIDGKDVPANAEIKEYVKGRPAYAVPQGKLRGIDELKQLLCTDEQSSRL